MIDAPIYLSVRLWLFLNAFDPTMFTISRTFSLPPLSSLPPPPHSLLILRRLILSLLETLPDLSSFSTTIIWTNRINRMKGTGDWGEEQEQGQGQGQGTRDKGHHITLHYVTLHQSNRNCKRVLLFYWSSRRFRGRIYDVVLIASNERGRLLR